MLIERRASGRCSAQFPPGTVVTARPRTVSRPLAGTVVAALDAYTISVRVGDLEVAIDTEDCADPTPATSG